MALPIRCLLTLHGERSQHAFAWNALAFIAVDGQLEAEPTVLGLQIRAFIGARILEVASVLKRRFGDVRISEPVVETLPGPPVQEPYYAFHLTVPEAMLGAAVGYLNSCRVIIESMDAAGEQRIVRGAIPILESLWIHRELRHLLDVPTAVELTFGGYRNVPGRFRSEGT